MRNSSDDGASIPDYHDMTDEQRQGAHDFACANTDVIFEEYSRNRTSLITEKQYFNATCQFSSKIHTNDYNLRFHHFFATGKNYQNFEGNTRIVEKESFYQSGQFESTFSTTNKTSVEFKRSHDNKQFFKVFFTEKLHGANITYFGMFHS